MEAKHLSANPSRLNTRYTRSIGTLLLVTLLWSVAVTQTTAQSQAAVADQTPRHFSFADAQAAFYNGQYDHAVEITAALLHQSPADLATYELRSSALLFRIRRAIPDRIQDRDKALKQCTICPAILEAFQKNTTAGVAAARVQMATNPDDVDARFFLGKLNLNHVWLHLGTLGRRTGWDQYWEGRRSLDAVLARSPQHLRARVARAWIDYIVDTKVRWGTRWILGGGDRKGAITIMRESALAQDEFYATAEARFALWEIQVREKHFADALTTARALVVDFPGNSELSAFIEQTP